MKVIQILILLETWIVENLLLVIIYIYRGAISWHSKLQKCISLSTTEVEYIVAIEVGKEMLWMKWFLQELDLKQRDYIVHCYSQSAIELSKNTMYHVRMKHIDVGYHWIRKDPH